MSDRGYRGRGQRSGGAPGNRRGRGGPPQRSESDQHAFYGGPPPSARGAWSGPRYSQESYEQRPSYPARGQMPPPRFPPPGRGRGYAPQMENTGASEPSWNPNGGSSARERSESGTRMGPSGDTISRTSSSSSLNEVARQKKRHPIRSDDIAVTFSKLSMENVTIPSRPDAGGKVGQPIEVISNCWDLEVARKMVYMYFFEPAGVYRKSKDPDTKRCEVRMPVKEMRLLLQQVVDVLPPGTIYDGGHCLFSEKPLPGITKEEQTLQQAIKDPLNRDDLTLEYRIMEVQRLSSGDVFDYVTSKTATTLSMPQESVRLLDCILKNIAKGRFATLGRNALFYTEPIKIVHDKLFTIHKGFITSVRPQWKVRINVDMTCKAFFRSGNLADVMYDKYGDQLPKYHSQMAKDLRQIRVETIPFYKNESGSTYSRRFTVYGFSPEPASSLVIADLNQTVAEYFLKHHNITLKYPELPCAKVNLSRDVFIPMELLNILPYQNPCATKSEVASEVIRCAAVRPDERFRELQTFVGKMLQSNHPLIKSFGIKVSPNPVATPARVLPTPSACFGGQKVELTRGKWNTPGYFRPASAGGEVKWAILSIPFDRDAQRHQQMLASQLPNTAQRFNVKLGQPVLAIIRPSELAQRFQSLQSQGINFILFVLYDDFNYSTIKRLGDIHTGVRTQCVRGRTLNKPNVLPNLLLKINGKLGGVNWQISDILRREEEYLMVFGADVTHPSPTQNKELRQSIAAVLGSVTPDLMRYAAVVRQQATNPNDSKQMREIIDAMESSVSELLTTYLRNTNGRFPARLIFYRDGVSEGQFQNVLVEELSAIQRACLGVRQDYQPAITYIVVQKRHNIRFKPTNPRQRNVDPGTVVDTHVTHPREFDFYLCSQEGIQGTSKPAHYHVLYDDSNWSSDALQQFTFFLCHAYMRCPRTVSYPAPTYYAHLAAFRARDWVAGVDKTDTIVDNGRFKVHESQISGMYYL